MTALGVWLALAMSALPGRAGVAQPEPQSYSDLHWRSIGPFRAGRTVAVAGVPARPGVFYMAPTDGGVWKSTDYGRTWNPLFDAQNTGSIGALAVAASDPDVVYVGSGEGLRRPDLSTGDGIYKSRDAGKSWLHLGLRDGQQIQQIAVDPRDPERLFVAVVGHPYGPNTERGVYRSTDGGASFTKVLGKGDNVGAVAVVIDPKDSKTLYAALWSSRNGPWNLVEVYERFDESGLFKSTDGGTTWRALTNGLPKAVGRIGITISPADSKRAYAVVEKPDGCGVYRSSDAGATWTETTSEERVCGRTADFAGITADPKDRDTVYCANTTTYRSRDGAASWTGLKGAPGGDDYHTVWIDPFDPRVIALGSDQGATISVNGGDTWSSWYNQPTAQFYHVVTDDRFPYRVYGGQQESGSAKVLSRGNDGAITSRDFHSVGVEEYGYVAPDPLHPWLIYGGKTTVYDERTGQTQDVSPTYDRKTYRFDRTNPLVWNRVDKRLLYLGLNVIFATRNGGRSWQIISPDLTRRNPGQPATLEHFASSDPLRGKHRGVVYSISPSYIDKDVVWAGTDDGLVWRTADGGKHWKDVTPPDLAAWSRVTQIDASHFDRATAYVSVSRQRLDDAHPYFYRTHDGGNTWTSIAGGIPPDEPANTIREDPKRRGLLFAGTEKTVYVSQNDGALWQSLRNDLPVTSVRDLVVHGDDVVIGTHGRSFWILDDIAPLREGSAALGASPAHLFTPALAYRVRRNTNTDTPLPPEEPAGQNPPGGAVLDYWLAANAVGPVTLEINDASGRRVRSFSSTDAVPRIDPGIDVPTYWLRAPRILSETPGPHRFVWDLRYAEPPVTTHEYPIAAIVHDTPRSPAGVLALPGTYVVRLTVSGHTYAQSLHVAMDPRVTATPGELREQHRLGTIVAQAIGRAHASAESARLRKDEAAAKRYARIEVGLVRLLDVVEGADAAPTRQAHDAVTALVRGLEP